ncbi:LysE family translocator [Desulfotalea psychrophila]|uniref:Uncharacterized protein n=1 Tax=Desulfotalea psychrophila (strain LSv54 / DSM 12343) TaxID=177439 RepID=Q6AS60_DESPS|nr:LysE family translocator [Desulfotalea psychrophila]CAG34815.1 conserved hypothetical protein [Desulfotalea psychrophila LSv54]
MELHTFITCFIAVSLLTLTPGVDTILVIRNSVRGGWQDGISTSFGICSGLFIHAMISAMGLSLILLQTAWAFSLIKYAGAVYLIYLGLCGLRQAGKSQPDLFIGTATGAVSFTFFRSFGEGFLSNILNPKAVLFYLAFLPQFISPEKSPVIQSLIVVSTHFTVAMIYGCVLAGITNRAQRLFASRAYNRIFNGLTGSILIFIGIKLASAK